jgi:hypothetical protein
MRRSEASLNPSVFSVSACGMIVAEKKFREIAKTLPGPLAEEAERLRSLSGLGQPFCSQYLRGDLLRIALARRLQPPVPTDLSQDQAVRPSVGRDD